MSVGLKTDLELIAHVTNEVVVVGCRPYGRGWFASVEYGDLTLEMDGPSPDAAAKALRVKIHQVLQANKEARERAAKIAADALRRFEEN